MKLFDLTGKVAIVTGGSRGIGRAISLALAEHGAKVVVASRKLDACAAVAKEIEAAGGAALAVSANIGYREQVESLVAATRRAFGRIDILVCNAAINPHAGPLTELTDSLFDKLMATNVKSNLWFANSVLPEMAERRDGVMMIVSSIAGLRGSSALGGYGITKAADLALVRQLAVEWGPRNIRVNAIAPGGVDTAIWESGEDFKASVAAIGREATIARMAKTTPSGRFATSEEMADSILYLLSDAAANVTGHVLVSDGGFTL